ncbi:membrane protein insertase YidC [Streptococcus porcinus]|uniref:Membrane protein insertase YidC n=1 Tax=Streptococcus porcinus TaxID=1340 RepID=A0A7W0ARP6_STRPO|nr:membrane protein insertase YidC [Streptococcus porcinus]MBA2796428.1 membrane protein insertase YidC [Streptococcus porcinus]
MKLKLNRILFSTMALSVLFTLTGCVGRDKQGNPTGIIWDILGKPMSHFIEYFANHMGLGFGLAIIIVTIIVRTIILPLGLYQAKKASYQSEKMAYLKPVFDPINQRVKNATTQEEKFAAQSELMAAQKENGINMLGGMGCLPLLIQMPFFSAMYFAALHTKGISTSHFLGIDLGSKSLILTAIIAVLYFFQSWLSMQAVAEEQRAQMKTMMYTMPIMMIFMTMTLPAGVGLYWLVGGFFSIIQQLITTYFIKPKLRQQIEEEFKNNPPKVGKVSNVRKDVTPSKDKTNKNIPKSTSSPKNRNAGKQKRR